MKFESKEAQFEALRALFPASEVKTRKQGGATLSYYTVDTIRQRLNDVFMGDYEFTIKQVFTTEKTVDMSGVLVLHWMDQSTTTVEEWGSADILYTEKGNRASDSFKSSASDLIKRCLAFVGCGAELSRAEYREGLDAARKIEDAAAKAAAMSTCQECQGPITAGTLAGKAYDTPDKFMAAARRLYHKRLCIDCCKNAAV